MTSRANDLPYHLLKGALSVVAFLPLCVLYVLADALYFLIYFVARYRRHLVRVNLKASFPEKSEAELRRIERQFYRNFADYIVETIKLLHISDDEIKRRMVFTNPELIDSLTTEGRSVAVYFSHCGNWEWAPSVTLHCSDTKHHVDYCQVYRPLVNRTFDRLMLTVRGRFGSLSFAKQTVLRDLLRLRSEGIISVTGFMSDQKPSHGDPTVVTVFLNQPTAFISGTETLARKLHFAAVYWDVEKPSRGHYRITAHLLARDASTLAAHELTLLYAGKLQETIQRTPSIWLWTHNRWKNPVTLPASL